jgi:hypothetical protein
LAAAGSQLMKSLLVWLLFLLAIPNCAKATQVPNPYPNELQGFRFYDTYLAPLQPYISDLALVVKVLGSDRGIELRCWSIYPTFLGEGDWAHDIEGRLASVDIAPKQRVSMLGVKFSSAFTRRQFIVAETNLVCDVYSDSFGLQYWVYAESSTGVKKGDLWKIIYERSEKVKQQIEGPH